jgi:hypothetical protein
MAVSLLNTFSGADWQELTGAWRNMPTAWKVRCAETIDSYPSAIVESILVGMLQDGDPDVVVAAADSLRSMTKTTFELSAEDFQRISAIRDSAGPVVRIVLGNFLQKVAAREKV